MKLFNVVLVFLAVSFFMASCEDEPTCKTCSGEQVTLLDGDTLQVQTISGVQLCDQELDQAESGPVTATTTTSGVTATSVIEYSCN